MCVIKQAKKRKNVGIPTFFLYAKRARISPGRFSRFMKNIRMGPAVLSFRVLPVFGVLFSLRFFRICEILRGFRVDFRKSCEARQN